MSKCLSSTLLYSISGGGKTTQVGELARWVHARTGKLTRLVSASGGGWGVIQAAVDVGIIKPVFIRDRPHPIETIDRMSKAWWPLDPEDPTSPLVAAKDQKDWGDVGAVVFESITEIAEWLQQDATRREAAGEIRLSAEAVVAPFTDGATRYGSPSRAGYGFVQNHIGACVAQSKTMPGRYIMWTALELKATDDMTKLPMYGPDIIGKAKTAIASAWFDNTLHLYMQQQAGKPALRRLYLQTHYEGDGIPYVAKNRADWRAPLPEYLAGDDLSLYRFYELLEASQVKAKGLLEAKLAMAPQH